MHSFNVGDLVYIKGGIFFSGRLRIIYKIHKIFYNPVYKLSYATIVPIPTNNHPYFIDNVVSKHIVSRPELLKNLGKVNTVSKIPDEDLKGAFI